LEVDNAALVESAFKYLLQLGHRRIGFIVSDLKNRVHFDRMEGYKRAVAASGLSLDPALMPIPREGVSAVEHGHDAMVQMLLNPREPVTAVISVGFEISLGIARAVHAAGKDIGNDISLISFDDSLEARYFNPPLTVLDVPNRQLGYTAGRWTHQWINSGEPSRLPLVAGAAGQLIIRESTAVPASLTISANL
jgi:LacI family transcriptional regulator